MDFGLVNDRHNLDIWNARLLHKDLLPEVGCQDFELYKGSSLALFDLDKEKKSRAKTGFSSSSNI